MDIDFNADATILLGDFRLEKEKLPEKMLLLRLSGMLSNASYTRQEKEDMALNIYNALRPLTGKRGLEMRRFGGSFGPTCPKSDLNLLRVLSENIGALPRKKRRLPYSGVLIGITAFTKKIIARNHRVASLMWNTVH